MLVQFSPRLIKTLETLDDHCRWVLHEFAEVLQPLSGHCTIDYSVIGAKRYRDHVNLFEAIGRGNASQD